MYCAWKMLCVPCTAIFVNVHRARTHMMSIVVCVNVHLAQRSVVYLAWKKTCYVHRAWLFFVNVHRARTPDDGPRQYLSGSLTCIVPRVSIVYRAWKKCTVHRAWLFFVNVHRARTPMTSIVVWVRPPAPSPVTKSHVSAANTLGETFVFVNWRGSTPP